MATSLWSYGIKRSSVTLSFTSAVEDTTSVLSMNKYDLSILIPARNEMFLANTVADILRNKRGNTEIIVHLDGQWSDPTIPDHEDLTIIFSPEPIGQRAGTNKACKISRAKYVMKADAHIAFDEGFDVKLLAAMQGHDDWTIAPLMRNLHVFDWVCPDGHRRYQSPSGVCKECGKSTTRDVVWIAKESPRSTSFLFDPEPHFQYFNEFKKRPAGKGSLTETLSLQGSCFMLTRQKYWELDICNEEFGSWGSQGIEVAVKTWLSGGKVMCLQDTWYAHMFRTQGGDFGFPYPQSGNQVQRAKKRTKELFFENKWDKQIYPLSWLIERFWPVERWTDEDLRKLKEFDKNVPARIDMWKASYMPTKEIIFYTDNQLKLKYAHAVQDALRKTNLPIVSASLKPMPHFGRNIHIPMERGLTAYFNQIIQALEASATDIVYMCEHDVIYHPSHFDFIPPDNIHFFYNVNFWRIRPEVDDFAVHWDAPQVSGLVCNRQLLLDWYKAKWKKIQTEGFDRSYEPGGRNSEQVKIWRSEYPNVDIRHGGNLTKSKWSLNDFRDKSTATGWQEGTITTIPGWDTQKLLSLANQ